MSPKRTSLHGQWSSRVAFVLAAAGSAVGLGNMWKFPYITGMYGGGAFVLVYLICIAVVGIPIMIAEVLLGRRGRRSPLNTMRALSTEETASRHWQYLGWGGMVAGFLILSYYSVIAGWALAYVFRTAAGVFTGATADGVVSIFAALVADPERLLAWHTIFMVMTMAVVARGVRSGLEQAVRYMMPALFVLLLVLLGYALDSGKFAEGFNFMFHSDFSRLSPAGILVAMGHAFFTLSLGMGAIMMYGSYLPQHASIGRSVVLVAVLDTLIALLAGLAIFPLVFANGLQPAEGAGLIFKILPIAFGQMPGGALFGALFFTLVVLAAWTSSISLIEPAVAWLVENHNITRLRATVWCGVAAWLLGMVTVFSFNVWSDVKPLAAFAPFKDKTLFDLLDFLTANIMLPSGGLAIAVFTAWVMSRSSVMEELDVGDTVLFRGWHFVLRYLTPVAVVLVLLNLIGVIPYLTERLRW